MKLDRSKKLWRSFFHIRCSDGQVIDQVNQFEKNKTRKLKIKLNFKSIIKLTSRSEHSNELNTHTQKLLFAFINNP